MGHGACLRRDTVWTEKGQKFHDAVKGKAVELEKLIKERSKVDFYAALGVESSASLSVSSRSSESAVVSARRRSMASTIMTRTAAGAPD